MKQNDPNVHHLRDSLHRNPRPQPPGFRLEGSGVADPCTPPPADLHALPDTRRAAHCGQSLPGTQGDSQTPLILIFNFAGIHMLLAQIKAPNNQDPRELHFYWFFVNNKKLNNLTSITHKVFSVYKTGYILAKIYKFARYCGFFFWRRFCNLRIFPESKVLGAINL